MDKKPFSKSHYDQDDSAKYQVVKYFRDQDYDAYINPDKFGIDVLADKDGVQLRIEVEVKHNWKGPNFQYETLHYSDRKRKFLEFPENTYFVTLNHERTHALMVSGRILSEAPTIVKDTIYTKGEKFIEVMTSDCQLIHMPQLEDPVE